MPDANEFLLYFLPLLALVFVLPALLRGKLLAVADAKAQLDAGTAVLIDVREPGEWQQGVAAPANLCPLSDLLGSRGRWKAILERHRGKLLILYCASGMRSGQAAGRLRAEGFQVANLGGFRRWVAAGLPVRQP